MTQSATTNQLMMGKVIAGKYRLDEVIGAGGMGVVYGATHLELEARVAIKVVREEFATNEEIVQRLLLEARAVAKLRSAHVVRVLDAARLPDGAPYIVMEALTGQDLASALRQRSSLPSEEAVDWLLEACAGLAEAHALGIVHRDLKPENLYLSRTVDRVVLKILDFGISKELTRDRSSPRYALTRAGDIVGSPHYMSPEQMRAQQDVDERTDLWALGAILFELLSGRPAFDGESLPVVCSKVLNDEPPALRELCPAVPAGLAEVVRRCLRKERKERYSNVLELAAALRAFASVQGQLSVDYGARLVSGVGLRRTADSILKAAPLSTPSDVPVSRPIGSEAGAPSAVPLKRSGARWLVASGLLLLALLAAAAWHSRGAAPTSASATAAELDRAPSKKAPPEPPAAAPSVTPVQSPTLSSPIVATTASASASAPRRSQPMSRSRAPAPSVATSSTPSGFELDTVQFGGRF